MPMLAFTLTPLTESAVETGVLAAAVYLTGRMLVRVLGRPQLGRSGSHRSGS
jgi:hypothetical protein